MRAIGIVRRIDELGRIVIPKEIRRTKRIESGDEMEIYLDDQGEIMLKKYSSLESREQAVKDCCNALAEDVNAKVIVTDRHKIVAESGKKSEDEKALEEGFLDNLAKNGDMILSGNRRVKIAENEGDGYKNQGIFAVNRNGILHGAVVLCTNSDIKNDTVMKAKLITRVISENIGEY